MNLNEMFAALAAENNAGIEVEREAVHAPISQREEHDEFERGAEDMERRARRLEAEREAELEAQADMAAQEAEPGVEMAAAITVKRASEADERAAARVAHENARRAKYGKAKLTAEEARKFEHFSEKNAAALESVCEECTAYEDWFTFNRWIAQGKVVQKGQKGTKITVYFPKEEKLRDGSKKKVLVPKDVACFCRHQVKTLEAKGRAA